MRLYGIISVNPSTNSPIAFNYAIVIPDRERIGGWLLRLGHAPKDSTVHKNQAVWLKSRFSCPV